jgi:hypothetical protein
VCGQLGWSELAGSTPVAFAHTRLVSKPCQVTLPLGEGGSLSLGFSLMLVKWVMTGLTGRRQLKTASPRASLIDGPGSCPGASGQASVTLRTESVPHKKGGVSFGRCDVGWSGWRSDGLR